MGCVKLSSLVRAKRHGNACAICPKGEASTLGLRAPLVPKAKLGHSDCVRHRVFIFRMFGGQLSGGQMLTHPEYKGPLWGVN